MIKISAFWDVTLCCWLSDDVKDCRFKFKQSKKNHSCNDTVIAKKSGFFSSRALRTLKFTLNRMVPVL